MASGEVALASKKALRERAEAVQGVRLYFRGLDGENLEARRPRVLV